MNHFRKIYLIAGEASGDLLGAHLMRALKARSAEPIQFFGIGGDKMEAQGLKSLFPYYELSMMGFIEILPYLFNLAARVGGAVDDILAKQPDVVITIDSPGFCLRVVERLRKENCKSKFVHYVAPSIWAYKPERAQKCARLFDHLLCLLPIEPPYFEKVGLPCTWVGHPVVAETKTGDGAAFRRKYEISDATTLISLLPGSRKGEVERHMPIFAKAVSMLATQYPDIALAVTVPKNVMGFIAPYFENCPYRAVVTADEQDRKDALKASRIGIVKSGTVALEVAMAGTPMLIAYRVHPISAWLIMRMALTKYVNLVNILLGREAIPELIQSLCAPIFIASAASHLLASPQQQLAQKQACSEALAQLKPAGGRLPSDIAAETILGLLNPALKPA